MTSEGRYRLGKTVLIFCALVVSSLAVAIPVAWLKWEFNAAKARAALFVDTSSADAKKTLTDILVRFQKATSAVRSQDLQASIIPLTARLLRAEPLIAPASDLVIINSRGVQVASSFVSSNYRALLMSALANAPDLTLDRTYLFGCDQKSTSTVWLLSHRIQSSTENSTALIAGSISQETLATLIEGGVSPGLSIGITVRDRSGCELLNLADNNNSSAGDARLPELYKSFWLSDWSSSEPIVSSVEVGNLVLKFTMQSRQVAELASSAVAEHLNVIRALANCCGLIALAISGCSVVTMHDTRNKKSASKSPDGSETLLSHRTPSIETQSAINNQVETQLGHAQKMQAVGHLAAGIAHDFNNLLTAVLSAADAIAEHATDEQIVEDTSEIRSAVERGAQLVRQLLAFGRQQDLQPKLLDVNVALTALSGLLRRLLGGGIRLELVLEPQDCQVTVDHTQFDQVLVNLAVNARDAMSGRGLLALHSGLITLLEPLLQEGETIPVGRYVTVEVRDTGCGIPPELISRVFEPFFTTKRDYGGSGLGLSTVHGIVRQSGGFISVESTLGTGTLVRIYLPHCDQTKEIVNSPKTVLANTPASSSETGSCPGLLILVDDENSIRGLTERALTRKGWQVIAAESAEEALQLVGNQEISLRLRAIVTDLAMPGMDGLTLIRSMRHKLLKPSLPAILMSGYTDPITREALEQDSATQFLGKPFSINALEEALVKC